MPIGHETDTSVQVARSRVVGFVDDLDAGRSRLGESVDPRGKDVSSDSALLMGILGAHRFDVSLGVVSPSAFYLVIQLTLLLEMATHRPMERRRAVIGMSASWMAALAMLPFVRTLHPDEVIEDPAIMLATVAALLGATLTIRWVEQTSD